MGVYVRAKFEVSSLIVTCFRQGGVILTPSPQEEPLKSQPRLGLNNSCLIMFSIAWSAKGLLHYMIQSISFSIFLSKPLDKLKEIVIGIFITGPVFITSLLSLIISPIFTSLLSLIISPIFIMIWLNCCKVF